MLATTENSITKSASAGEMGNQKITVLDHVNGFHYSTMKSESCIIDMENVPTNSRITLKKNLSRKGSQYVSDRETQPANSSSPRGSPTSEKELVVTSGTSDHGPGVSQVHHQISINTNTTEGRINNRKNICLKRPPFWLLDPKKVLLFFATLSSVGTIFLILFTLSSRRNDGDDISLD